MGNRLAQPWNTRNWVQLCIFILTIAIGMQFFGYVRQLSGEGPVTIERPAGVEAFLPIGALMGWKLFVLTGIWDPVHPAAMVLLGFAGQVSLVLRKAFCSWFCPLGTLSEWLWKIGQRLLGGLYRLPVWLDYPLRSLKYLLLGFFVWAIFSMDTGSVHGFLQGPYYKLSDVKMLFFFTRITQLTALVLVLLVLASLLVPNFWCRYLCPYGALMGLLALLSPTRIERDPESCIGCGKCTTACPNNLAVDRKQRILSPECTGCMDCTRVCPEAHTLSLKTLGAGKYRWSTVSLGILILGLFVAAVYSAKISGHWQSQVSAQEARRLIKHIDSPQFTHPQVQFKK